jgi:hypothetical protein
VGERPAVRSGIAGVLLLALGVVAAAQGGVAEYDLKAAYLYNFARFVDWPAAAHRPATFDICVLGEDPFGTRLDAMVAETTVRGRQLAARRIASPAAAADCQVLFISASEERQLASILAELTGTAVLTVSDMPEFVSRGGMLQFVTQGSRVRFDVNLGACEAAGLRVSSDLLRVASAVRKGR